VLVKKISTKKAGRLYAGLLGVVITLGPMTASALVFRFGEVGVLFDVSLAYGLQLRTEDPDPGIVAIANGGKSSSGNLDDGTLNYKKGHLTSNIVRGTGELTLAWRNFGVFARGYGFYDFKNKDDCCERTDLTDAALDLVGSNAELLDHYISAKFEPGGRPVQLRLGSQVLNWGESTFLQGGVNIVNPVDLPLFLQPTSTLTDLRRPVGMLWGAVTLTEVLGVEAFYQYQWKKSTLTPLASFFSTSDAISPGTTSAVISGSLPDTGVDLGPLGFDPNFGRIPRVDSNQPSDQGQWGITLEGIIPQWGDANVAVYFVNYHSRLPVASVITPDEEAYAANTLEATDERAQVIAQETGLPAEQAAQLSALVGINQYANATQYFTEYPENIKMFGLSFNHTTISRGISLTAEIAHHLDAPMQIGFDPFLVAALDGIELLGFQDSQLGNPGPNERIKGFIRRDYTLTSLGFSQLFGPQLGASQTALGGEVGWMHVWNMPSKSDLRLWSQGLTASDIIRAGGKEKHYADTDSFGYRLAASLTYPNVLRAVTLQPGLIWSHDFSGNSPLPAGQFLEGSKAITVSLQANYLNEKVQGEISYTNFFGAGRFYLINDRDYVNLSLRYSF
jgi:hypothetical protein